MIKIRETIRYFIEEQVDLLDWFGSSVVTDSKGKPLIVYHGSNSNFNEFKMFSDNMNSLPAAAYFTDSVKIAKKYGESITKCYLKIENPIEIDMEGESFHTDKGYYKFTGAIKEAERYDHDGVIAHNMIDTKEPGQKGQPSTVYVVFSNEQIKKK